MKLLAFLVTTAIFAAVFASAASAFTSTRCYWIGTTYTCTTTGGGTMTTTRCYTIGNTVRCSSY